MPPLVDSWVVPSLRLLWMSLLVHRFCFAWPWLSHFVTGISGLWWAPLPQSNPTLPTSLEPYWPTLAFYSPHLQCWLLGSRAHFFLGAGPAHNLYPGNKQPPMEPAIPAEMALHCYLPSNSSSSSRNTRLSSQAMPIPLLICHSEEGGGSCSRLGQPSPSALLSISSKVVCSESRLFSLPHLLSLRDFGSLCTRWGHSSVWEAAVHIGSCQVLSSSVASRSIGPRGYNSKNSRKRSHAIQQGSGRGLFIGGRKLGRGRGGGRSASVDRHGRWEERETERERRWVETTF